ncbi:CHY zinc finger protein [Aspergillus tanneri]|uniref:CHY-type domain-containing protein n=1 Tax=Aspergillus tanneri TaxID=1220188 RepID=A0A5M9MYQ3_9EURO|nr:uncharacterized protein ATNIH1004_001146 [Aspergillus tanneri]KAA8652242.1 hypothetical protein ATNIH1004_001146 [Aspergillus tanneri]
MSGLLSSLLIGPIVRQARRRFSQPIDSQPSCDHNQVESSSNVRNRTSSASSTSSTSSRNGDGRVIMSDSNYERHSRIRSHGSLAGSNDGPATPTSTLLDGSSQNDEGHSFSLEQNRQVSDRTSPRSLNIQSGVTPRNGSIGSGRHTVSSPYVNRQENPNTEITRIPDNRLDMDDIGTQPLLPEDDGMGILRQKIHAIRDLKSSSAEKARMVHELMTANYNALQGGNDSHSFKAAPSPSSSRSPERAGTPTSRRSRQSLDQLSVTSASPISVVSQTIRYNVTEDDMKPTFYPGAELDSPLSNVEDVDVEEPEEPCLGCSHYKRNVKLQCFHCKKWYTCRFCHDEVEDHQLNRPQTENMLCMLCGHAQSAAQFCRKCGELTAQYYCNTCKLWDNDSSKSIYHCNDCGICRIGQGLGKDFFHCKTCCGDALDSIEQDSEGRGINTLRFRSSSQSADVSMLSTLESLRVDTGTAPETSLNSQLSAPSSAEQSGRFSSYSLSRGRAVSPVISNYFGIPPYRGPERSYSTSLFGRRASRDDENDNSGEFRIWGTKFKYGYRFLGGETESGGREDEDASGDSNSENEVEDEDEEYDDDDERFDIFGHR